MPTTYARIDDTLYVHGATANHALKALAAGVEACVTVTLVDGLVLARSAFHHSINYRSVMLFGPAVKVDDEQEKFDALTALVEHLVPGRSDDTRPPRADELRKTLVVKLALDECSAKVRTGGPIDDEEDMDNGHWAGVLPLRISAAAPEPDGPFVAPGYLTRWDASARAR
jgi:nitroimidazol reductase NimA-like FMN-containing flavoprotein (pyridoxamine 5'-phosphate oxidase superfamily)